MTDARITDAPHILITPIGLSGEPMLGNHLLPLSTIAEHAWLVGVGTAMEDYGLTRPEMLTACWYLGAYGVISVHRPGRGPTARYATTSDKRSIRALRRWAEDYAPLLRDGDYDAIPDPPIPSPRRATLSGVRGPA